jgi:hypothetical protein
MGGQEALVISMSIVEDMTDMTVESKNGYHKESTRIVHSLFSTLVLITFVYRDFFL